MVHARRNRSAVDRLSPTGGNPPPEAALTFEQAAVRRSKMLVSTNRNGDGTYKPQTVTVQAAYQGKTASYTFTVTDHFSPRRDHASAVLNGDLYVIGGFDGTDRLNDVWKSTDGGAAWVNVHENP